MGAARRITLSALFVVLIWICLGSLYSYFDPGLRRNEQIQEDARWVATSKWWLDRQACRHLGICGIAHFKFDPASKPWLTDIRHQNRKTPGYKIQAEPKEEVIVREDSSGSEELPLGGRKTRPEDWHGDKRVLQETPSYVLEHAPLIYLYSKEQFWPADLVEHLQHMEVLVNNTPLTERPTMTNLKELNNGHRGLDLFMNSIDDVENRPAWLHSAYNKPVPYGDENEYDDDDKDLLEGFATSDEDVATEEDYQTWFDPFGPGVKHDSPPPPAQPFRTELRKREKRRMSAAKVRPGGWSDAPATLIMVDKGHGILDAFWFYFYSYNLGTTVLDMRFGNHVGDWEHTLIRFHHGEPKAVFFSAHQGGLSFAYEAVEKGRGPGREGRPVFYSAVGSHAMYAMPGSHPYILPFGLLADLCDKGPLWDPSLNHRAYFLNQSVTHNIDASIIPRNVSEHQFLPSAANPDAPTSWFWYTGHYGDKTFWLSDIRQWRFAGQYHYADGPFGPWHKNLGRSTVCGRSGTCKLIASIKEGKRTSWMGQMRAFRMWPGR